MHHRLRSRSELVNRKGKLVLVGEFSKNLAAKAMTLLKLQRLLNKRSVVNNKSRFELIRNQIDFFWSSRLRRSFQIYNFYRNLWDETALREFLKLMRNNIVSDELYSVSLINCQSSIRLHFSLIAIEKFSYQRLVCLPLIGIKKGLGSMKLCKSSSMSSIESNASNPKHRLKRMRRNYRNSSAWREATVSIFE